MAKRKTKKTDYRAIKKALNRYFDFSFDMPKKGKDFTPQQKSALTRKLRKVEHLIDQNGEPSNTISFIKYPKGSKLPRVDAIRTDKGIFYKLPGAKAVKTKRGKYLIVSKFKQRKDIFFPFPNDVLFSLDKIQEYVDALERKYRPDTIRWSTRGRKESNQYAPEIFSKYTDINTDDSDIENEIDDLMEFIATDEFSEMELFEQREYYRRLSYLKKKHADATYYNGVFLTWFKD